MKIDIAWFPNYGHLMAGIFYKRFQNHKNINYKVGPSRAKDSKTSQSLFASLVFLLECLIW